MRCSQQSLRSRVTNTEKRFFQRRFFQLQRLLEAVRPTVCHGISRSSRICYAPSPVGYFRGLWVITTQPETKRPLVGPEELFASHPDLRAPEVWCHNAEQSWTIFSRGVIHILQETIERNTTSKARTRTRRRYSSIILDRNRT